MAHRLLLFITICMASAAARGQVSITGPSCVVPGLGYQYLITTTDTSGTGISICLTGGKYTATGSTCLNDSLVSAIYVMWDSTAGSASISYTSPAGTASENISITIQLQPGSIDAASLQQTIADSTSPATITCNAASGGSCSPSYGYQWQQSNDNLSWADVSGATGQDFNSGQTLTQSTFFRRKVTEASSGSIAYSNIASVFIAATAGGSDSSGIQASVYTPAYYKKSLAGLTGGVARPSYINFSATSKDQFETRKNQPISNHL